MAMKGWKSTTHDEKSRFRKVQVIYVKSNPRYHPLYYGLHFWFFFGFIATVVSVIYRTHALNSLFLWFSANRLNIFRVLMDAFFAGAAVGLFRFVPQAVSKFVAQRMDSTALVARSGPYLAQVFLLMVPARNREHIIGDLEEEYRTTNKPFPRLWYWGQVITLVARYWWAILRRWLGFDSILKMIRK